MNDDSSQPLIESADRAYAGRQAIQNVHESAGLLRDALTNSDDYEIAWRLSRALFFLGQESKAETTGTSGQRSPPEQLRWGGDDTALQQSSRSLYAEGVDAARRAVRSHPERVDGHFWLGVNLGLLARLEPRLIAIAHALEAKRVLQKATAIDAAYHAAGPLRVLARLQHKLPRWLGGGVTAARANFERAIAIAPENTVTRIYFAELLLESGETTGARAELESILNAPFDPDWAFEIKRDRLLAKDMLASLGSLE